MTKDMRHSATVTRLELQPLLTARKHCHIVHHVPGRVRLRFDPLGLAAAIEGRTELLETLLTRLSGIRRTEVNAAACSVVVHYDVARLPAASWARIFNGSTAAAVMILDDLLASAP